MKLSTYVNEMALPRMAPYKISPTYRGPTLTDWHWKPGLGFIAVVLPRISVSQSWDDFMQDDAMYVGWTL